MYSLVGHRRGNEVKNTFLLLDAKRKCRMKENRVVFIQVLAQYKIFCKMPCQFAWNAIFHKLLVLVSLLKVFQGEKLYSKQAAINLINK